MPDVTLRDFPDDLYSALQRRAEQHHTALSDEVVSCLSGVFEDRCPSAEEVLERARELRTHIRGHLTDAILTGLKTEGSQ